MADVSVAIRDDMERCAADLLAKNRDAKAEDLAHYGFTAEQVAAYGAQALRKSLALLCRAPARRLISPNGQLDRDEPSELATAALVQAIVQVARRHGVPAALSGTLNAYVTLNCSLGVPRDLPEQLLRQCLENLEACYQAYAFAKAPAANHKARPS